MGVVALWHVGFSRMRNQTTVSCTGRQILYHRTTREALKHFISRGRWALNPNTFSNFSREHYEALWTLRKPFLHQMRVSMCLSQIDSLPLFFFLTVTRWALLKLSHAYPSPGSHSSTLRSAPAAYCQPHFKKSRPMSMSLPPKNFYIWIYQGYWSAIFFSCSILLWFCFVLFCFV